MRNTGIEWTDRTANPLVGCTKVSSGCANCYAERDSNSPRLQQFEKYQGIVDSRGHWTGEVRFESKVLAEILRIRKPQKIFLPSMSDPFHPSVKDEWLDQIFAVIALCPHLTFQLLTKRPERMLEYLQSAKQRIRIAAVDKGRELALPTAEAYETCQFEWPLPNLWLGVSVENQPAANERIPLLLQTPAAVRFLSCEPLLEKVDIFKNSGKWPFTCKITERSYVDSPIDWVIVGGESGPNARPCDVEWIRSIVYRCKVARIACFVKQLGGFPVSREPETTHVEVISRDIYSEWTFKAAEEQGFDLEGFYRLKLNRKGDNPEEWPEDLRVREFPLIEETEQ